jgi:hypothetical protein
MDESTRPGGLRLSAIGKWVYEFCSELLAVTKATNLNTSGYSNADGGYYR